MVHDTLAHVASVAIRLAISEESISITDVKSELEHQVDEKQIRQVLAQLEDDDWVNKNEYPFEHWRAGTAGRQYGDMVTHTEQSEGRVPVIPGEKR